MKFLNWFAKSLFLAAAVALMVPSPGFSQRATSVTPPIVIQPGPLRVTPSLPSASPLTPSLPSTSAPSLEPALPAVPAPRLQPAQRTPRLQRFDAERVVVYEDQRGRVVVITIPPPPPREKLSPEAHVHYCKKQCQTICGSDGRCLTMCKKGCEE